MRLDEIPAQKRTDVIPVKVSLKKTNPENRVLVPLVEYSPFSSYYPT